MNAVEKQQLIEKSKELLVQARYFSVQEIFLIETALNNKDLSDEDLRTVYDSLTEYKNELDTAYRDFKTEVQEAIVEYTQAVLPKKSV